MRHASAFAFAAAISGVLGTAACKRELREFHVSPPEASRIHTISVGDLHPAGTPPPPLPPNGYEENAYAMNEGRRLFDWFNCSGCHSHGGGGMGPPLMDDKWIYGAAPEQIFATILEGRPNGMPSFRGKIPDQQVWQIVAYVRSMSGNVNRYAAPLRDDHLSVKTQEQSTPPQPPSAAGATPTRQ